ncbi:MAG: hypothetical protein Fur0035_22830 [Anaerolineales bacterium]
MSPRRQRPAAAPASLDFDPLFQHNPQPMWIFDLETLAFLAVNEAAIEKYGYSREEFLRMTLRDIRPAEDVPALEERIARQDGSPQRLGEWRHRAKNGQILRVEVSTCAMTWQGRRAIFAVLNDISEQSQRRAEIRALWQKHVQLEEIVNRSRSIAFVWRNEPGWPVDFVSDNISQLGYAPEELTRPDFLYDSLILPDDLSEEHDRLTKAMQQRQSQIRVEYRLRDKDGQIHWVEDTTWINYDRQGYPLTFSGLVTDISERKQAEQKLLFQAAVAENVSDAIIATDADFRITLWNRAAEEMYGWQADEVLGLRWGPLAQTEYFGQSESEAIADLLRDGFWSGICSQARKDGSRFFLESRVTMLRDSAGKIFSVVAVNRDITERILAEQRLRASEERFRLIFEQSSAGVARVAVDGRFIEINRRFCELLGYSREEMLTKSFQDITYPDDLDTDLEQVRRLLAGELESYLLEKRYLRQDRQILWASLSVQLVRDLNGKPDYFISVVQDVTERKLREREIETIYQSGREFDSLRSPKQIAEKLIEILATRLDWNHAGVWLRRPGSDALDLAAFSQPGERDPRPALRRSQKFIRRVGDGLTGWVIANGRSVLSGALKDDPRFLNVFANMNSGLYVPIQVDGQTIGCISVESAAPSAFNEHHQRLLETLAGRAAAAIANANLLQNARQRAAQMETLVQAGRALSSSLDESALLQLILQAAQRAIPAAEKGSVMLLDENGEFLNIGAASGYSEEIPLRRGLPRGKGYAWQAVESGLPLLVEDIEKIPSRDFFRDIPESDELQSSIAAPLTANGRVTGVLCLDNASRKNAFSQDDLQLLAAFAASAAISLENARLFEQTRRRADELSSLMEVSLALRSANTQQEIIPIVLNHLERLFGLTSLAYVEPQENGVEYLISQARGVWQDFIGRRIPAEKSLAAQVHASGEYFYWPEGSPPPAMVRPELIQPVRNLLGVPLIVQSQVIASLWLGIGRDQPPRDFSPQDIRLVHSIVDVAANAINRIGLFQQSAEDARRMAVISALGRALGECSDLETLYRKLALAVYDLLPDVVVVMISRFDARRKQISCVCAHADGEFGDTASLPILPYAPKKGGRQSKVIATRRPLIVNDIPEWKSPNPASPLTLIGDPRRTTRAALYVPMMANGQVIGLLQAQSYTPGRFSPHDADLLGLAANTGAVELQNALLLQEARRRAEQLVRINAIGRMLTETLQEEEIHRQLAQLAIDLIPGSSTVYLSHYNQETKTIRAVYGLHDGQPVDVDSLPPMPLAPPGGGIQSEAILTGRPFIAPDLRAIFRKRKTPVVKVGTPGPDTRSALAVPMLAHGNVIGVLQLQSYQRDHYSESDGELLGLAANAAAAVENARLYAEISAHEQNLLELNQLGRELAATFDLNEIYRAAYRHAARFMDCANFAIDFFDEESQTLRNQFLVVDGKELQTPLPPLKFDPAHAEAGRARAIFSAAPLRQTGLAQLLQTSGALRVGDERPPDSALYAPMLVEGKVIGLIEAQSYQPSAYNEMHSQLLAAIGSQLGLSIEGARLFAQTQKRLEQISALRAIDNAISSSASMNVTLTVLLEYVRSQLQVDAADILLLNEKTLTLEYAEGAGFYSDAIRRTTLRLGEGLAGRAVAESRPVLIPDLAQSGSGFIRHELQHAESFQAYACVPLVTKGEVKGVLEVFQRSKLSADDEWSAFLEMLAGQAAIAVENTRLFDGLQRSNQELIAAYDVTIEGWSQALELRDEDTEGHSRRVTDLALDLARALGVRGEQLTHMRRGGLLHDIGKLGVPDSILHKPGPLTPEEWQQMRQHPVLAHQLLSKIPYLAPAIDIPYCHHEKWDGSGYPRGLKGEQIPLAARIFAISDVFDALTSDRVYRKALSRQDALEYIREQAGKHFAPRAVEVFLRLMKERPE